MMNINVQIAELQGTWDTGEVIIGGNVECDKIIGEKYCNGFYCGNYQSKYYQGSGMFAALDVIYGEFEQSM